MASALMTFTAVNMKKIADYLEMEGVRKKYKLAFGGGPLSEAWAKEMGADGYAPDAVKAVELAHQLMSLLAGYSPLNPRHQNPQLVPRTMKKSPHLVKGGVWVYLLTNAPCPGRTLRTMKIARGFYVLVSH